MNIIWTILVVLSVGALIFISPDLVLSTMIDSATNVVSLCIELIAIYTIWLGVLEIVDKTGLADNLAKLLSPVIKKIFKTKDKTEIKYIALNISANLLGLGNAATPSGIKAIQTMEKNANKTTFAMLMLVVINACGIQLFPTTVISLRTNAGSTTASDILFPTLIATIISGLLGIALLFLFKKLFKKADL